MMLLLTTLCIRWSYSRFISIFDVAFTDGKIVLLLLGVWSRALQIGKKRFSRSSFLHFGKWQVYECQNLQQGENIFPFLCNWQNEWQINHDIAKTSQSKKLPSKTMKNYCNTWKKWSSTKAQQVFLTSAHKLLSTQEDYQLKNFIFTIIHPGTLKSNKPRCITLRPSLLLALFSIWPDSA